MRKRSKAGTSKQRTREREETPLREYEIAVPFDAANEQVILGAMMVDEAACDVIRPRAPVEAFQVEDHKIIRDAIEEARRQKLGLDPATLVRLRPAIDVRVVEDLMAARPDGTPNLEFHMRTLLGDWVRAQATRGPIQSLVDLVQDPQADMTRLRSVARQVADAFAMDGGDLLLSDKRDVLRRMREKLEKRAAGEAWYPYGIHGLDFDEAGKRRHRPGTAPGMISVVTARSGGGKALALDTPIPTPSGWSMMGELEPGDVVFDENGFATRVVRCSQVMVRRRCYEVVFSDGASIVADAEHLWLTKTALERRAAKWQSLEARERQRISRGATARREQVSATLREHHRGTRKSLASVKTTDQIRKSLIGGRGEANHAIEAAQPLALPEASLVLDPYLFGAWLGDGSSDGAVITSADAELPASFADAGYTVKKTTNAPYRYGISEGPAGRFSSGLRQLGVLKNKHVPVAYLRASIEQRRELLRGLMDTDGCISVGGKIEFCTTSPRLRDGFYELATSLGIVTTARESDATIDARVVGRRWRFQFKSSFVPFRMERKAARWVASQRETVRRRYVVDVRRVESVPVKCIQVDSPSHLFLAGRAMVPTHNSTFAGHIIRGQAAAGRKTLVGAWEIEDAMTLELLATMELGWSRSRTLDGRTNRVRDGEDGDADPLSGDEIDELYTAGEKLMEQVTFLRNPYQRRRRAKKTTNEDHIDALVENIKASGAEVVLLDLYDRMLDDRSPEAEQNAIFDLVDAVTDLQVHLILVHQQLLKGKDVRADKRPSIEGLKGSSAITDGAALILAPTIPALIKNVPDNTFEVAALKGRWCPPFAVEFDWDPDTGQLSGGRTLKKDELMEETDEAFGMGPRSRGDRPAPSRGFNAKPRGRRS